MCFNPRMLRAPPGRETAERLRAHIRTGVSTSDAKQLIGEDLYVRVYREHAPRASKITGMFLECTTDECLRLIEDERLLESRIKEANLVLDKAGRDENGMSASEAKKSQKKKDDGDGEKKVMSEHDKKKEISRKAKLAEERDAARKQRIKERKRLKKSAAATEKKKETQEQQKCDSSTSDSDSESESEGGALAAAPAAVAE